MTARRQQEDPARQTSFLYAWLLVAMVFEYVRPAVHFPPLGVIPLNSMIPLSLFLVTMVAKGLRPWGEIFRDPMTKWLFVFMVFMLASMIWAENRARTLNTFKTALGYFFMFIMIARIVVTRQRVMGVFLTLILCHLFLIIVNSQVILDPSVRHYLRGAPFMGDGNDYSLSVVLLLPLAIHIALTTTSRFKQIMWWLAVLLLILACVGTQSRGATLGIAAIFGYMWLRSSRKGLSMVAIAVAALIAIMFAPAVYFERMSTITAYQEESSAQSRIEAWKAGTRMALNNPLGVGAGNFPNNFPKYRGPNAPVRWMTAHSMYFLVLGELGVLGLALFASLVLGNVRLNTRLRRALEARPDAKDHSYDSRSLYMMSASFVGLAVAGAFLSVTYYPHVFVLNGLALAYRALVMNDASVSLIPEKKRMGPPALRRPGSGGVPGTPQSARR